MALGAAHPVESRSKLLGLSCYQRSIENSGHTFEGIFGFSEALVEIMDLVRIVGRTDSTRFLKLNCAAIPAALLERELFGHERGAFPGAVARKVGRFEIGEEQA